ncbi:MAG: hypothetical protein HQL82_09940 [Magnetococcales bacterium]|nr:hypothetical protein [Magnetococcales bacterium]
MAVPCEAHPVLQEINRHLGRMDGHLDGIVNRQGELTDWFGKLDARLRVVESRSAIFAMLSGGAVGLCVSVLGQFLRDRLAG